MTAGQLTGIAFIFALNALIPSTGCVIDGPFTYPGSSVLLVVCVALAFIGILGYKGSHKRLKVDGLLGESLAGAGAPTDA